MTHPKHRYRFQAAEAIGSHSQSSQRSLVVVFSTGQTSLSGTKKHYMGSSHGKPTCHDETVRHVATIQNQRNHVLPWQTDWPWQNTPRRHDDLDFLPPKAAPALRKRSPQERIPRQGKNRDIRQAVGSNQVLSFTFFITYISRSA